MSSAQSLLQSLLIFLDPVEGIHVDKQNGHLNEWYFDALDKSFWNKLIENTRDPSNNPIPERLPNQYANYHNRHSYRNRNHQQQDQQ